MEITHKLLSHTDDNKQLTIYIDNVAYQVNSDNNLLAGVLSKKLNLPYFCWHPSMGSVGACRQCAVTQYQDENDHNGRLVMACTTAIKEGMRIGLNETQAKHFREQIIAAMMTNHPHDCPVCAEGGECHLQDMTVMTGHSVRQYQGKKRTFTNQHLGEFVGHEMNRCITCYRCVRFYKDYAGGTDFGVYGTRNQVYFGRQEAGQLTSEFSGNLVEVCPTGVFTNKLFSAHYARKWDLQSAPSICAHCAVGCHTSVGERYGSVRRVMNRYDQELNGYFLCDRGRFGIGFVNSPHRIRQVKGIAQQSPQRISRLDIGKGLSHFKGKRFIGVGSGRASLEANYYLQKLVGDDNFCAGLSQSEMTMVFGHQTILAKYPAPSIREIEQCDFVLIIDEDITQIAPRIALAVRQSLRNASIEKASVMGVPHWQDSAVRTIGGPVLSPLYQILSKATKLDEVADKTLLCHPDSVLEILVCLGELLLGQPLSTSTSVQHAKFIESLLTAFKKAKKPLIIGGWSQHSGALITAIDVLIDNSHAQQINPQCLIVPPQSNTVGVMSLLTDSSLSVEQVLQQVKQDKVDGIFMLEQEMQSLTNEQLNTFVDASITLVVLDHSHHSLTHGADIVLPVATVTESDGHYVNYQGRIQRFTQVHPSVLPIQESWRWLSLVAKTMYPSNPLAKEVNSLDELHQLFLAHDDDWTLTADLSQAKTARETHRTSGRTAKMANITVHEVKSTVSHSNFSFSMEGTAPADSEDMPFSWAPGWNSNQSISQCQPTMTGQLSSAVEHLYMQFKPAINSPSCLQKMPLKAIKRRTISLQTPWYRGDWQANLTPEFTLMKKANMIFVSTEMAAESGWQQGQWFYMTLSLSAQYSDTDTNTDTYTDTNTNTYTDISANNRQSKSNVVNTLAQLCIDERIDDELVYGDLDLPLGHIINHYQMQVATTKQIQSYQQTFNHAQQQALDTKAKILAQLKSQDQTIPIRLVSGGLDDI